jgi:Rho-binding antiterminator
MWATTAGCSAWRRRVTTSDPREPGAGYVPIPCARYDFYEIAIMHRSRLRLGWQDGKVSYEQEVTPLNLETRDGEEFLILCDADGIRREVRLDRIRHAEVL